MVALMTDTMGFSDILQRRVRLGSWEDQKVSTYRRILESLDAGAWEDAAELASYFVDEAAVCWQLYRQWLADLEGFLRDEGTPESELAEISARLDELTVLPDGSPFDTFALWEQFKGLIDDVIAAARAQDASTARRVLDEAKEV